MHDSKKLDEIKNNKEKWEESTLKDNLSRYPERKEKFITTSSEEINRRDVGYLADS